MAGALGGADEGRGNTYISLTFAQEVLRMGEFSAQISTYRCSNSDADT
jgi:hypothetical protein